MATFRWIPNTRNKLKLALALVVAALLLFVVNMFEKEYVADIDESFLSLYNDRLVPATSIFEMRENMYDKRELLKDMLRPESRDMPAQRKGLHVCDSTMKGLLHTYKQTYFWQKERDFLREFEADLQVYNQLEADIVTHVLAGDTQTAQQVYEQDAAAHFKTAVLKLSELNHIQSEIGKNMVSTSQKSMAGLLLLYKLELSLIVLFGVIAHILIYASRIIIRRTVEPFHMN